MSQVVTDAPPAVRMPPATRLPPMLQALAFATARRSMMSRLARRYGRVFTVAIPLYGQQVVVGDPQLAKQVFTTSPEVLGNIRPNLSRLFGSGSVFGLEGEDHRQRRRTGQRLPLSRRRLKRRHGHVDVRERARRRVPHPGHLGGRQCLFGGGPLHGIRWGVRGGKRERRSNENARRR